MERFLRTVLILSLLALAVLTPVWWLQEHPARAASSTAVEASTPEPTVDPDAARYREAAAARETGFYAEALAIWEGLGEYRDSAAQAEGCREQLYTAAWDCLLRRELESAAELLRPLGAYRDSARWLHYCERHQNDAATEELLLASSWTYYQPKHELGTLYACATGLFYLPHERGSETKTLLYFPGGSDFGIHRLNTDAVIEYISIFAPEAICFFAYESGFHVIEEHNRECWNTVEALLRECSLIPHDIVVVGTSNGFYAAEHMALQLWDEEELAVRALLSLDAGEDWKQLDKLLNAEQLARLSQAGTRLELFEQRRFETERKEIQDLLRVGLPVDLIECDNGDHEIITIYAFRLGVLSWALGECDLNPKQYVLTELTLEP